MGVVAPVICGHASHFAGHRRAGRGDRTPEQRPGRRTTAFGARAVPPGGRGHRQVPAGGRVRLPGLRAGDAGAARPGHLDRPRRPVPPAGRGAGVPVPGGGHPHRPRAGAVPPGAGQAGPGVAAGRLPRLSGDGRGAGRGAAAAALRAGQGGGLRDPAGGPARLRHRDHHGRRVRHRQPGRPADPVPGHPAPRTGRRPRPRTLRRAPADRGRTGDGAAPRRAGAGADGRVPGGAARGDPRAGPPEAGRTRCG